MNYNSDTTEEFDMMKCDKAEVTILSKSAKSAEILMAVPNGVGRKSHYLYLCLADTGTSSSLANAKVVGPRSKEKKKISATYQTQVGKFTTEYKAWVEELRLP